MKKIFAVLFFISLMCGFSFAQSSFPEIDIAKEIKLLKSTRSDVNLIMAEFDTADEDDDVEYYFSQTFSSERAIVQVFYSMGDCSEEADDGRKLPAWNVPKMTATKVVITFFMLTKLKNLGLDLSRFRKRLEDEKDKDSESFIYYDENAGIIIQTYPDEVRKIILHPPKNQADKLCRNASNSRILSRNKDFADSVLRSDAFSIDYNFRSRVTNLELRTNGIYGCKDEKCLDAKKEISVKTTAIDLDHDYLTYQYIVTGGKIKGSGANVIWDLTGVEPGMYMITAGSDDGCGVCGDTQSRQIFVKENSYELIPPAKIKELILDKTELVAACPVGRLQRVRCESGNCGIAVTSTSTDGKNLIYKYKTDGGEIIGSGDKVIWDLANLKPDEYRIEVSASKDGTVFGEPKTATVEIKENPNCSLPKK